MNRNAIYFDMDGTLVEFYQVPNWLDYLIAEDVTPYQVAQPALNFSLLARYIHKIQAMGIMVGIVSWTSKSGSEEFHIAVEEAKRNYLRKHLPSVKWDEIYIIPYGTPKSSVVDIPNGILFDDEAKNRDDWSGIAFDETNIIEVLKEIAAGA